MNADDLESLRRRVERQRRQREAADLKREINGWNNAIDERVVYMTTREVMNALRVSKPTVLNLIHSGELEAIRSTSGSPTASGWCVHPASVDRMKKIYRLKASGVSSREEEA